MDALSWRKELMGKPPSERFAGLYGGKADEAAKRWLCLTERFIEVFGNRDAIAAISAPGRTELGGNHTDHQRGNVLAAAVDMDAIALASANGGKMINLLSEGYPLCRVDTSSLSPKDNEKHTSEGLIRGVAAFFAERGCQVSGFDACVSSQVLPGSGLSSSAAFEVLVGSVINTLFFDSQAAVTDVARIAQRAENDYFGKPCGLMDQLSSAMGGVLAIDFSDAEVPKIERIEVDIAGRGCCLCIIDTGASHARLTGEYAAIIDEMRLVAAFFGKTVLRDVPESNFVAAVPALRRRAGDRAILRAMHFFDEDRRVVLMAQALKTGDFERFLSLVEQSGQSSWMYLQNVVSASDPTHQETALALALCRRILGGRGAYRIHGGGFAGTVQAYVPLDMLAEFCSDMEEVFGKGSCHTLGLRPVGAISFT